MTHQHFNLSQQPKIEFQMLDHGFQLIDAISETNSGFYPYRDIQTIEINKPWFPRLSKWLRVITWVLNGVPYFPSAKTCKKANLIIHHEKTKVGIWLTDTTMSSQAKKIKMFLDKKRNKQTPMSAIRMITKDDLEALIAILESIDLFPSEMLEEMMADYLSNPESEDIWFTATANGEPVSLGFCAPEKLTDGTYNLYALGVKKEYQGQGLGLKMVTFIENHLRDEGHRILVVDTSGTDDYATTRKFYENLGYSKEAVIRDFWEDGDDKVVYWKKLG